MRDYISIGPVPASESCTQVGAENFYKDSHIDCEVFANMIRREFPEIPAGVRIATKSFPHDFGTYYEVVVYFEDENEEQRDYAYKVEGKIYDYWDDTAIEELKQKGYSLINQIDHSAMGGVI